jgi:hypothetical protein
MNRENTDHGLSGLVARCRRSVAAADRGWKATALGVAIVAVVTLLP